MAENTIHSIGNGGNGYVKLPSGVLIQWGTQVVTINTNAARYFKKKGSATVTFPLEFAEAPTVVVTPMESGAWWNATCNGTTTTSINVHMAGDTTGTRSVYWIAFGKAAV